MKQSTLFIAPLGTRNKREAIFKEIVSLYPENNFTSVLYLAPNNSVLTEAKRQFFSYLKKAGRKSVYIPFQAFTIKQLAEHIYEITPPSPPLSLRGGQGELPSSERERSVISERMRTLILCGVLKDKNVGYASLLSDLFRKIRHYILDKDLSRLTDEVRQLIFEEKTRDRAVKAIEILQLYEKFIEEKNLIDTEDVLKNVGAGLCACPGRPQGVAPTIVIDGFYDPTPLEIEIINALIGNADKAVILAEENTELLRYFLSRKEGLTVKTLERSIHRESTGCYSFNSAEEEVEGIAKNIKKLIFDGVKPWEITVCFPSLLQYLPMLRRIFTKYGIPTSIGEYRLSATKPFAVLEEIISCIENGYPRNDFLSLVTSPCLPAIQDAVKKLAVTLSYRAGIIKGKDSWLSIKDTLISSNELSEEDKERIAEFQKGIAPVIDALENMRKAPGMSAFIDAFETALNKFGFFDYLKDEHSFYGDRIAESIKSQFSELRQFAGLFGTSSQAGDAGFYLWHLLSDLTASDETIDGVKVLPFELAAALESKALFFGGLIEGSFPSRPGIDPVLPEKVKKTLGIPHLEYYLERQRVYFTRLLNASTFDPYLSCPSADGDKIFLPSPFLDWEKLICPADLNIFTEEDILIREGSELNLNNGGGADTYFDAKAAGILRGRIGAISKKYFRVTDIDYYRKCPFKFYLERILGLEIEEPPRFEVEYRQWGNLAHKTMEYLFKDNNWELEAFEKRLFKALEKSLKEIPIGAFWSNVTKEIFRNLLPMLKKQETEIRMQGFSPWLVEEKIEAEISGIRFRGKIDRVDRKKSQTSEVRSQKSPPLEKGDIGGFLGGSVILLDYKTGSIDKKSLQLPLYSRMWQENHPEPVDEAGYYSLKEGKVNWYPPKKKNMEEYIQEALQETAALIEQMKKGMFPAEPVANECRNCNHSALCEGGK